MNLINSDISSDDSLLTIVNAVLSEDRGTGDISAALIPADQISTAKIITREAAIICGIWIVTAVFHQLSKDVNICWLVSDGDAIVAEQNLCIIKGPTRALLTGERSALNFLQTLSATATMTYRYMQQLQGTSTQLLDTRKTIPGLRRLQKYAVLCRGGYNHRLGLYDAYLLKENHIISCGSITAAVLQARKLCPEKPITVEVENLAELTEALAVQAPHILLDNFTLPMIRDAVTLVNKQAKLEVSGNINLANIREIAELGVDYISVGALTKHICAIDLSMQFYKF